MTRKTLLLHALSVYLAFASTALAKPNLAGEWKLNLDKSDFGPLPSPKSRTDKIAQDDGAVIVSVSVSNAQGDFTYNLRYATDGSETKNEIFGNPATSTAKWDGEALAVETKGTFQGNDYTAKDRYTVSADGKTLTVERRLASAMGEADQKLIFDKQ